ncbi:tRNA (uridine(34)/cytosine(34)/5-carboxymethylaminomethyluridine(34)-2'-O)-methyltransferase TrmL [Lacicoccus alkaliphilus]|jgi:tRNA (cytidine/uridine-2'-O-)-methyltransferase|uniref:Putative tRNA (cytidine(34)-2'-O)-methyltransferase n=1 Tax=Lacicoccus alkaliphilus DSM 16010 TaxID=1123231 RepID=A0A1M7A679_9BACL|nr:tRNA (uridine(34)/cytosine(34)/5-carboxymethylaminomethyluridine(34)-2'-O)-methyltransferase TrmL [Salinicoccus alkaliphilus]SHL38230.1 tRNA (cytidine/uridine-2'-O-)-methyltransferase [Salinicoccus alkaliphilus DSM 16010]
MPNHIVLFQPEIPQNTGNIARTCAATNTTLHLIKPLGFSVEEKMVRRAGLDYWEYVDIFYYDSIEIFFDQNPGNYYMLSKFGKKAHSDMDYSDPEENHYFVFGRETTGLPEWVREKYEDTLLRVPMTGNVRSLNLANTATMLVYEALRQQNYPELI